MELFFNIAQIVSPFVAAGLAYYFVIRGKRKQIEIEKEKELNTVLSNLLLVWNYLTKLEEITHDIEQANNSEELLFPKEFFPQLFLDPEILDNSCFKELEISSKELKKYDPITYFKLSGIGKNLDHLQENYIIPMLNIRYDSSEVTLLKPIKKMLSDLIKDIEKHLISVATEIDKKTKNSISDYIKPDDSMDEKSNPVQNANKRFYDTMISMIPPDLSEGFTYEKFKEEIISDDEFREGMHEKLRLVLNQSMSFKDFINVDEDKTDK